MDVAIYTRVSTEEQARHGLSLEEQERSLKHYAAENNMNVFRVYSDPGVSARCRYTKRHALMQLLQDAQNGKFQCVIFIKLDRWVRSVRDYYAVQEILDQSKVTWRATMEDYETETASGRFKVNIMLSVAQDEADRTSERIKFVFDERKEKGLPVSGKVPYGYKLENKDFAIVREDADFIRELFETYAQFGSVAHAVKWARQRGFKRTYQSIRCLLENERYIGNFGNCHREELRIIPDNLFFTVQRMLKFSSGKLENRTTGFVFLFSGLLKCKSCGKSLSGSRSFRSNGNTYVYYRCNTHFFYPEVCGLFRRVNEKNLEDMLLRDFLKISEDFNSEFKKKEKKRTVPDTESIKRKLTKLKDLYLEDIIDINDYKKEYECLKGQLLSAEQEKSERKELDIDKIKDELSKYSDLTRIEKQNVWRRLIDKIEYDGENFFIYPFVG